MIEIKYMDKVRVTKGFYEGLEGYVTKERNEIVCGSFSSNKKYFVSLNVEGGYNDWVREDCLEKIEGDKS